MERELRGGIGMGNTCKPMAVSFQCMTKYTRNKRKKRKKEKKIPTGFFGNIDKLILKTSHMESKGLRITWAILKQDKFGGFTLLISEHYKTIVIKTV